MDYTLIQKLDYIIETLGCGLCCHYIKIKLSCDLDLITQDGRAHHTALQCNSFEYKDDSKRYQNLINDIFDYLDYSDVLKSGFKI